MIKYRWEWQHDNWVEDFKFEQDVLEDILRMIKKHPDDGCGIILRKLLAIQRGDIEAMQKRYKKTYGRRYKRGRDV